MYHSLQEKRHNIEYTQRKEEQALELSTNYKAESHKDCVIYHSLQEKRHNIEYTQRKEEQALE